MNTLTLSKKRKNIDIRSIQSELYQYLTENRPEGNIYLNEVEQSDFENWLGI